MFNLFRKKDNYDDSPVYDQGVLLNIDFSRTEDIDLLRSVLDLEKSISSVLIADTEIVDGHDISNEDATIYIYGPSADEIWKKIEDIVKKSEFRDIEVTLRYGSAEDMNSKEKRFTLY